jgi:RNA polymerase-binding transcription factor DksA
MHYRYLTIEQREALESLARRHLNSRALDAALARLHRGDYGVCAQCGADIAFVLLQDNPLTQRCRACHLPHPGAAPATSSRAGTPAPR